MYEFAGTAERGMVCAADASAAESGREILRAGGNAVDAAVAANAVLAVTLPNQCGLGGDLYAVVHRPGESPVGLNASGRAGSGADPGRLRAQGHRQMPVRGDVRSVTVPGCVDGWVALNARQGHLSLREVLEPAHRLAADGFAAPPYFVQAVDRVLGTPAEPELVPRGSLAAGETLRRPGMARLLAGIASDGRRDFYEGEFADGLLALGEGLFTADDLRRDHADWVDPIHVRAWGHSVWSLPPSSQGYLTLTAAWLASRLELPTDPDDPRWTHLLVECVRQASYDRPEVLHDHADGDALLGADRLESRLAGISAEKTADLPGTYGGGDTTYLCAVDEDRTAVSLIQSNAMSFGSGLVAGDTGVFLQNRGIGFNLVDGHPAEFGAGRRPPHTLAPLLVTTPRGDLHSVLGTRGGDSQPAVVLQILARILQCGQDPATALAAPRWVLRGIDDDTSFATWRAHGAVRTALEGHAPTSWPAALRELGHLVEVDAPMGHPFGHAQVIVAAGGRLSGAADPRSLSGGVAGL